MVSGCSFTVSTGGILEWPDRAGPPESDWAEGFAERSSYVPPDLPDWTVSEDEGHEIPSRRPARLLNAISRMAGLNCTYSLDHRDGQAILNGKCPDAQASGTRPTKTAAIAARPSPLTPGHPPINRD